MFARTAFALLTAMVVCSACDDASDAPQPNGTAGTAGVMAVPMAGTSGGAGASTGGAMMMAGIGGVGATGGSAGTMPSGGSGGVAGVDMSSGGMSGGVGGMDDSGTPMMDASDPEPDAATPSAGCAAATGRPDSGLVITQDYYFAFPESYDGTAPMPVLMGFHGCGAVNRGTDETDTEFMRITEDSAFATDYVRAVPISADAGGCWNYGNDIVRVKAMYDALLADHCVDTSRVFATGHSSGAQFVVQVLLDTHSADAQYLGFKGVAPFAASDYGAMTGPIPVMYIQGMMDAERGNGDGHETVERFRAANHCGSSSTPYTEVAGCQSGATAVTPGCVIYDDCDAVTIWCSHNDPQYAGTMHGIPCFGISAMHDFFESLM